MFVQIDDIFININNVNFIRSWEKKEFVGITTEMKVVDTGISIHFGEGDYLELDHCQSERFLAYMENSYRIP